MFRYGPLHSSESNSRLTQNWSNPPIVPSRFTCQCLLEQPCDTSARFSTFCWSLNDGYPMRIKKRGTLLRVKLRLPIFKLYRFLLWGDHAAVFFFASRSWCFLSLLYFSRHALVQYIAERWRRGSICSPQFRHLRSGILSINRDILGWT